MCKELSSIRHLTLYFVFPTKLRTGESSAPHNCGKGCWSLEKLPKQPPVHVCVWCLTWELFPSPASLRTSVSLLTFFVQTTSLSAAEKQGDVLESALELLSSARMCLVPKSSSAWVSCGILSVVSPRAQLPSPADLMRLSTLLASPGTAGGTWNKYSKLHFPRLVWERA